jgi:hypothetical protein
MAGEPLNCPACGALIHMPVLLMCENHIKHLKALCGNDYPRKPWGKPLGIAFVCLVLVLVLSGYVSFLKARAQAQQKACVDNQYQIEAGKANEWSSAPEYDDWYYCWFNPSTDSPHYLVLADNARVIAYVRNDDYAKLQRDGTENSIKHLICSLTVRDIRERTAAYFVVKRRLKDWGIHVSQVVVRKER